MRTLCLQIRSCLQGLSRECGVEVEPPAQTSLMDQVLAEFTVDEVWYVGIPGAGGHDALFVLGPPHLDLQRLLKDRFCGSRRSLAILPVSLKT